MHTIVQYLYISTLLGCQQQKKDGLLGFNMRAQTALGLILLLGLQAQIFAVPGCPGPRAPGTVAGNLHVFTLSVNFLSGEPTLSLLQQTICPGGANRTSCPVKNLADMVDNPYTLHPNLFGAGFKMESKPYWLAAALAGLPDNDLVVFLDGADTAYGGCGNTHPDGLAHVLRLRLLELLQRANATIMFGAEVNRYDSPCDHAVPQWASDRCPHLTNTNGNGDWIAKFTDCPLPAAVDRQHLACEASVRGGNTAMSNVNTGTIAGYVCEVRGAASALTEVWKEDPRSLRGGSDQGKYFSYFMDDESEYRAARGDPNEATLDYCSDIVLNMWRLPEMPLHFNLSFRTVSFEMGGAGEPQESAPLCFIHFNGRAWTYKEFETVTLFSGIRCHAKRRESQKTGVCAPI